MKGPRAVLRGELIKAAQKALEESNLNLGLVPEGPPKRGSFSFKDLEWGTRALKLTQTWH